MYGTMFFPSLPFDIIDYLKSSRLLLGILNSQLFAWAFGTCYTNYVVREIFYFILFFFEIDETKFKRKNYCLTNYNHERIGKKDVAISVTYLEVLSAQISKSECTIL